MCKYCSSLDKCAPQLFRTHGAIYTEGYINGDELEVSEYYYDGGLTTVIDDSYRLKIAYCPMCGKKL